MTKVWRRRLVTAFLKLGSLLSQSRWIVLSIVLAAVGVIDLFVVVPGSVGISLALISAVLVVVEIRKHLRLQAEIEFGLRKGDDFADVRKALAGNPRFECLSYGSDYFLYDKVASREIGLRNVSAVVASVGYVIPSEFRELGTTFRRRYVSGRIDSYNGHVVGLGTDLGIGSVLPADTVSLVPARYWDYLASDTFATTDVLSKRAQSQFGRSLFIDRHGNPRDFGSSWLLNGIGCSVIGITTDHRVVVVLQSDRNDGSKQLHAPSGSGSLEPQDLGGADRAPFCDVAAAGAIREMQEEAGIGWQDVDHHEFLGFGRWLDKAAKPEAFTVAFLTIDSHEVARRKVPRSDTPFTKWAKPARFSQSLEQWDPLDVAPMMESEFRLRMSLPQAAGLGLLARAARDRDSPAHRELVKRMSGMVPYPG